jgi:hypothetical protein
VTDRERLAYVLKQAKDDWDAMAEVVKRDLLTHDRFETGILWFADAILAAGTYIPHGAEPKGENEIVKKLYDKAIYYEGGEPSGLLCQAADTIVMLQKRIAELEAENDRVWNKLMEYQNPTAGKDGASS